ncbi:hypothetical protein D3C79_1033600 [compost metagenome]
MAVAPIMATVAEPTAACSTMATSQASSMGCMSSWESMVARLSPRPLALSTPLKAPPAPMMSKMLAMEEKHSSVLSSSPSIFMR